MMKRIFSLLVALCLIVGLLPAVAVPHAHAEDEVLHAMLRVMGATTDLHASTDGKSTYLKNEEVEETYTVTTTADDGTETTETITFTATKWVYAGNYTATEPEEWNVKFEYPAGGVPTITLKGAIYDYLHEESGEFGTSAYAGYSAITGKTNASYYDGTNQVLDLNVVIAEDSYIATKNVVVDANSLYGNVTVTSIDDAKLTTRSTGGIGSNKKLTLNANLDMEVYKYAAANRPLRSNGGIEFNGGNYKVYCTAPSADADGDGKIGNTEGPVGALIYTTGGDIVINDGTFELGSGYSSTTGGVAVIQHGSAASTGYTIKINGGDIHIINRNIGALLSKNPILVTGGCVRTTSTYYSLASTSTAVVKVTGGSVKLYRASGNAMYGSACLDVSEYPCCVIKTGSSETAATVKTAVANAKYISVTPHELTEVPAVAPDCVNDGTVQYWNCPTCGNNYADAEGTTLLESIVDPATGVHTAGEIVKENEVAAGCNEGGTYEAVEYCTGCSVEMSRTTVAVDPLGHTEVAVEQVDPTTTAVGYTAGTKCSVCGVVLSGCEEIPMVKYEKIYLGGNTVEARDDGKSTYLKNQAVEYTRTVTTTAEDGTETTETITYTGSKWVVVASLTTEEPEEWNVKFEFPANGVPTVTLKGAILDAFDENTENTYGATTGAIRYVNNGEVYDLNVVIAEDSYIATNTYALVTFYNGVEYHGDVTITSIGDAKLSTRSTKGIAAIDSNVTVNANLDLEVYKYNGGDSFPICTTGAGNIVIEGGNITIKSTKPTGLSGAWNSPVPSAIRTTGTGNITINGGTLNLQSAYQSSTNAGTIQTASGITTVNGGTISIDSEFCSGLKSSQPIVINDGEITIATSGHYALADGTDLKMTGGSLYMTGEGGTGNGTILLESNTIDLTEYANCVIKTGTTADGAAVTKQTEVKEAKHISITPGTGEPACEHTNTTTTEEITKDATCTEAGSKTVTVTCADCGEVVDETIEEIPALGHKFDNEFDTECNNGCGTTQEPATYADAIGTNADSYGTLTVDGSTVTLNAQGEVVCKPSATNPAVWGWWIGYKVTVPAGIDAANVTFMRPDGSTGILSNALDTATEANFYITAKGATVNQQTYKFDWNTDGTYDLTVIVDLSGITTAHAYETVVTDPTCTEAGATTYTCACGDTYSVEIPALGHTEEIIPGTEATCTEAGLTDGVKCSVCGEALTAQEEIPATGHVYDDAADADCNVCGAAQEAGTLTVEGNKVVAATGGDMKELNSLLVFFVGDSEIADMYNFTGLKEIGLKYDVYPSGYKTFKTTAINGAELPVVGNYVLLLNYTDAEGKSAYVSHLVTVESVPAAPAEPVITVDGKTVSLDAQGNTVNNVFAFYVGDETVADPCNFNLLKTTGAKYDVYSAGYKAYNGEGINGVELPENGNYVLLVKYTDAEGKTKYVAAEVNVNVEPEASLELNGNKVTVSAKEGTTIQAVFSFYVGDTEVKDKYNFGELKTIGQTYDVYSVGYGMKKYTCTSTSVTLPTTGNYVILVQCVDANDANVYVSEAITVQ